MPEDRRIRRTKRLLGEALVELSLEKGYDSVTILEITEKADIAYATFFRRFTSKDDLLRSLMETVVNELTDLLSSGESPAVLMQSIFVHAQHNANLYRILLNSNGSLTIQSSIVQVALPLCEQSLPEDSDIPPEVAAYHIASSTLALVRWWLDNDMPYSAQHMARIMYQLVFNPGWQP